jgi:hypothetical protein
MQYFYPTDRGAYTAEWVFIVPTRDGRFFIADSSNHGGTFKKAADLKTEWIAVGALAKMPGPGRAYKTSAGSFPGPTPKCMRLAKPDEIAEFLGHQQDVAVAPTTGSPSGE